jgi:hypothetical protein
MCSLRAGLPASPSPIDHPDHQQRADRPDDAESASHQAEGPIAAEQEQAVSRLVLQEFLDA